MESVYTRPDRPVYVFNFGKLAIPGLPSSIGMVELNKGEIDRCKARVKGNFHLLFDEQVKESIVELDGKPVRGDRHLVDSFYDHCGQKIMNLCSIAYNKVNTPDDDVTDSFLNGLEMKV